MLQGIFYCEFDNQQGPVLHFQYPSDLIPATVFESISPYLITKPGLCGSAIAVRLATHVVLGHPIRIVDSRYERNVFLFNVGVVLDSSDRITPYAQMLRKLGCFLEDLERVAQFVSTETVDDGRQRVFSLLLHVFMALTQSGECVIPALPGCLLSLKLQPVIPSGNVVRPEHVPVPIRDLKALAGSDWDLSLRRLVPFIDGVAFVRALSELSEVPLPVVEAAISHLERCGFVKLVDIFQYSNIYCVTSFVSRLLKEENLQSACLDYVANVYQPSQSPMPIAIRDNETDDSTDGQTSYTETEFNTKTDDITSNTSNRLNGSSLNSTSVPSIQEIFRVYTAFGSGTRASEVFVKYDVRNLHLNERRLITFGVIHGLLRRLYQFPVYIKSCDVPIPATHVSNSSSQSAENVTTSTTPNTPTTTVHSDMRSATGKHGSTPAMTIHKSRSTDKVSKLSRFSNSSISYEGTDSSVQHYSRERAETAPQMDVEDSSKMDERLLHKLQEQNLLSGHHSFDHICAMTHLSRDCIASAIKSSKNYVLISRSFA